VIFPLKQFIDIPFVRKKALAEPAAAPPLPSPDSALSNVLSKENHQADYVLPCFNMY
jgi:hypothetical protein